MKWNSTFLHPFRSGDLSAAKSTRTLDLDALCTTSHSSGNTVLHSSSESTSVLKLLCNVLSDVLSIDFRLLDLLDLDLNLLLCKLLHALGNLLNVSTLCTDDDAWASCGDYQCDALWLTNDLNVGDLSILYLWAGKESLAELEVLMKSLNVFLWINIPLGLPGLVNTKSESDWINFLAHYLPTLTFSSTTTVI